ncbi:hypothetical protein ACQP1W_32450 [Spirillospora sp. CA-255316]
MMLALPRWRIPLLDAPDRGCARSGPGPTDRKPPSTPNVDLLKRTLAHIEAHPEEWDQNEWCTELDCGTAYCFAGWAIKLDGRATFTAVNDFVIDEDGTSQDTDDYAAGLLGIKSLERAERDCEEHLFAADNSLDDLRRIVGELCAEAES